jgi:DNA-binding GntR family transcriptional regulator
MIIDINKNGPTPIFVEIKKWMQTQINDGVWPEHFKLLNEIDLASELEVSRGTIRRAISDLIKEGLLVRIHGKGTFVASKRLEQPLAERLIGFSEDLIEKGIPFETEVLEQSVISHEQIGSLLRVSPLGQVFYLKRIRKVAGFPLVILNNYVVYEKCEGIEKIDFTKFRLFDVLENHYHLVLEWGKRTFEAQVSDEDVARLLEISPCDPVMNMEQIVYLDDGHPIEFSNLYLRGNRFRLSATLKRTKFQTKSSVDNEYS